MDPHALPSFRIARGIATQTQRFFLERKEDVSGVSGVGIVAVGVRFPNGKCVVTWLTDKSSVSVYDTMQDVVAIHGHGGATLVKVHRDSEGFCPACDAYGVYCTNCFARLLELKPAKQAKVESLIPFHAFDKMD